MWEGDREEENLILKNVDCSVVNISKLCRAVQLYY